MWLFTCISNKHESDRVEQAIYDSITNGIQSTNDVNVQRTRVLGALKDRVKSVTKISSKLGILKDEQIKIKQDNIENSVQYEENNTTVTQYNNNEYIINQNRNENYSSEYNENSGEIQTILKCINDFENALQALGIEVGK